MHIFALTNDFQDTSSPHMSIKYHTFTAVLNTTSIRTELIFCLASVGFHLNSAIHFSCPNFISFRITMVRLSFANNAKVTIKVRYKVEVFFSRYKLLKGLYGEPYKQM